MPLTAVKAPARSTRAKVTVWGRLVHTHASDHYVSIGGRLFDVGVREFTHVLSPGEWLKARAFRPLRDEATP